MCLFLSKITKKKFLGPLSRKPAIQKISSIVVNYSTSSFLSSRSIPGYNLRSIWSLWCPFSAFGAFPTPLSFYHSEIYPFLVIIFACASTSRWRPAFSSAVKIAVFDGFLAARFSAASAPRAAARFSAILCRAATLSRWRS